MIGSLILPARRAPSMIAPECFRFLGKSRALVDGGWDPPGDNRLWRYNLHYFDDLNSWGAAERMPWHQRLVSRWIRENPIPKGTGWEPYPTSLRVVNLIKWLALGASGDAELLHSLAMQVRWLSRRLEWHLLGNHLFVNAKALVFAGLFFEGVEADSWLATGSRILRSQLREQVLSDGGQFERSPMYHRLALEDVQDLMCAIRCFGCPDNQTAQLSAQLSQVAERMWAWTRVMQFSDGSLPRFNDTAEGVAPALDELSRVAGALGLDVDDGRDLARVRLLEACGYARLRWDDALAFLDIAPVGPDYLPGHAHADTLSFELEVAGQLLIVNRGTSCYGAGARRAYERSTAAHSTVEIAGNNSSEVWGDFRVGRRAKPKSLSIVNESVSCSHDGYGFLPSAPEHTRTWTMLPRGLRVEDRVTGRLPAVIRYHLAPGLRAEHVGDGVWKVCEGAGMVAKLHFGSRRVRLVEGEHALTFGRLVPASTLEVEMNPGVVSVTFNW